MNSDELTIEPIKSLMSWFKLGAQRGSHARNILLVLVVALVARLIIVGIYLPDNALDAGGGDGRDYWRLSSEPLSHPRFLLRPPLYPKLIEFIGLIWDSPTALIGFNIAISLATVAATMLLAARAGLASKYQVISGLVIAIDPVIAFYSVTALADPLFTLLVVCSGIALLSGRSILSGVLLGGAGLVKPVTMLLFAVMWRRSWRNYLVIAIIASAPVLMWTTHNYYTWGVFQPSSSGAYNLAFIKTVSVIREDTGESYESALSSIIHQIEQEQPIPNLERTTNYDYLDVTDSNVLSSMVSVSIREWVRHPKGFVLSTVKGAYTTIVKSPIGSVTGVLTGVAIITMFGMAAWGLLMIRKNTDLAVFLGGTIAYILVINVFTFGSGDARLRIPITPHLTILTLLGIQIYLARNRQQVEE